MESQAKPVSKTKIAGRWLLLLGNLVFWFCLVFWLLHRRDRMPAEEPGPDVVRLLIFLAIGGFLTVVGVVSYLVVIFTNCFTFNFNQPVWEQLKTKLFLANIFVPMLAAIGLGLALSAFLTPVLTAAGLESGLAFMLPMLAALVVMQMAQLWVLIWAPVEKQMIRKRLLAQGVTPAQLQSGVLVGISNPASGLAKRFTSIEEDMGVLWVSPDQLVYWGDSERFGLTRDQIVQIERRVDARSTTMLCGLAHVVLHIKLPDGRERQIRLHVEGIWTLGQKRPAMDRLADAINRWQQSPVEMDSAS